MDNFFKSNNNLFRTVTTGAVIFTYDFLIVNKRDHATGLEAF